jgi:hypothetical protein
MAIFSASSGSFAVTAVLLLFLLHTRPAHAFGAGNIASVSNVEGVNFRHGDIEDTLLTLVSSYAYAKGAKFSKIDVKRVYFGNWLRDYSQAVDVGTTKHVSAEAIRILLWVLGFLTFGYGTGEFEVTSERLGCYRPEEHIDNPLGYPVRKRTLRLVLDLPQPAREVSGMCVSVKHHLGRCLADSSVFV